MGAKAEESGEPFHPAHIVWMYPDQHHAPPSEEPGIATISGAGHIAIKAREYRPDPELRNAAGLRTEDIIPLVHAVDEAPYPIGLYRKQGVEAELNTVRVEDGEPFDLYPGGQPLFPETKEHPELWENTWEVDGPPEPSTFAAYFRLKKAIAAAHTKLRSQGAAIDPASARMQDRPELENNMTPSPYVAALVGVIGPSLRNFIGVGVHEHNELHIAYAPIVARYLRVLAPILNTGLHAAPFGFGQQRPRLGEILDNDELRQHDGRQPQSLRYLTRFAASPNGGVGLHVVHDTLPEALSHADRAMREKGINNPARQFGAHSDVRVRYDPPSADNLDQPGRVELCVKDTGGYRFGTLVPYGELTRAVVEQLERAASAGEAGVNQLHEDFPTLFGKSPDSDTLAAKQLPRAHHNSIAMAYGGPQAEIHDGTGNIVNGANQLEQVIRFATQGDVQLSSYTLRALRNSMLKPTTRAMRRYKDEYGLPSLHGYYRTGLGTAAQWMIARAEAAGELGFNEADSMRLGTADRHRTFAEELAK